MSRILVHGLEKSFGDVRVLERVNLAAEHGEFLSLVGASGCGKSTFLRIILGQDEASAGVVVVGDGPIAPEPTPDRGIVFQRYSVFPHLTVMQNLLLVEDFRSGGMIGRTLGARRAKARAEAEAMLERVGLGHARDLYPASLSGGMQQRLAIAQTLLGRPKVLLLDEPFGALDPGIRAEMHELLTEIWTEHGMTVLMVTHDIHEAFKLGTRVLVFDKVRHDPQFPSAYGATITYDLKLDRKERASFPEMAKVAALAGTTRPGHVSAATAPQETQQ
ncbi:ABC transporter ATP-binding protein [Mesorhizobium sp. L-8-10]|uniref:ATP-binding cassette domain-containing protein n=1 Tax=unclassified Mesorhizobium TaxID=325217 RepID=UPI001926C029|nr:MULTISPECIES: ATP-binding cassette domain-containing protein [unclassified Mesorhizobium]BCH20590.1 ABC transporter ATP-binding protein [Mesorhizobium sp. L-8-3]BCH28437.1 ABC transporter ATP-binding protein [Mesorhizobium sp. L-8-10]